MIENIKSRLNILKLNRYMAQITNLILITLQLTIAFGLLNVWLVRLNKKTKYRGANAQNMKEEFAAYGLPVWFMYLVGTLKIVIAISLVTVVFVPSYSLYIGIPVLCVLSVLMLGVISMHLKIRDSLIKTMPAIAMLLLTVITLILRIGLQIESIKTFLI